jgi:hypothetical protein
MICYPVAGRVDDLSLGGRGAGAHSDVAGPQRLPRLTKCLPPRLVEIRPQSHRGDGWLVGHHTSLAYL